MCQNPDPHILIVAAPLDPPQAGRTERALGWTVPADRIRAVSVSALKENMQAFFQHLQEIVDSGKATLGAFELSQIEVTAQVTGDGQVCLLGMGAKMEVQGAIKFVLHRTPK
jgi:hypothetical protein